MSEGELSGEREGEGSDECVTEGRGPVPLDMKVWILTAA